MIKSIMVCTDGSTYGDTACDYAIELARRLKARLTGLHVLDSRMLEGPFMADLSGWIGAQPYGAQLKQFRELMEKKGEAVINAFHERCASQDLQVETLLKMGHPPSVILEEESRAELLVLGRKGEDADLIGELMGSSTERIVRHSVKPCLVTPREHHPIKRLLAAYDGSPHAGQALREAAETAVALNIELIVLTVRDESTGKDPTDISGEAVTLAADHGCSVKAIIGDGPPADAILAAAEANACDLVVVGAYGHSRIREMILGSNTMRLVAKSEIPVMLVR